MVQLKLVRAPHLLDPRTVLPLNSSQPAEPHPHLAFSSPTDHSNLNIIKMIFPIHAGVAKPAVLGTPSPTAQDDANAKTYDYIIAGGSF